MTLTSDLWSQKPFQQCRLTRWIFVPSFIEIRPLSTEISRHVKYVLMDGQRTAGRTTVKPNASPPTLVGRAITKLTKWQTLCDEQYVEEFSREQLATRPSCVTYVSRGYWWSDISLPLSDRQQPLGMQPWNAYTHTNCNISTVAVKMYIRLELSVIDWCSLYKAVKNFIYCPHEHHASLFCMNKWHSTAETLKYISCNADIFYCLNVTYAVFD